MSKESIYCPRCKSPAIVNEDSKDRNLYVAQDCETSTECYDADIKSYICTKNKVHSFFLTERNIADEAEDNTTSIAQRMAKEGYSKRDIDIFTEISEEHNKRAIEKKKLWEEK